MVRLYYEPAHYNEAMPAYHLKVELFTALTRSEGPLTKSSCFLGDPPPDPLFLASLGALSLVELPSLEGLGSLLSGLRMDPPHASVYLRPQTSYGAKRYTRQTKAGAT